jgi:phosphohistidine phosphatase
MRHAKSSWKNSEQSDHDRPLNPRGKSDAPRMAIELKNLDLMPSVIISSTAERASRTAQLVAENCNYEGEVNLNRNLYHAGVDEFIEALQEVHEDEKIVMVVGHNPGVSELVDYLTDQPEILTTANVAVVKLNVESWEALDFETEGELAQLLRPRNFR